MTKETRKQRKDVVEMKDGINKNINGDGEICEGQKSQIKKTNFKTRQLSEYDTHD